MGWRIVGKMGLERKGAGGERLVGTLAPRPQNAGGIAARHRPRQLENSY